MEDNKYKKYSANLQENSTIERGDKFVEDDILLSLNEHKIPHYIVDNYSKFYTGKLVKFLDNKLTINLLFFLQRRKLEREVLKEIGKVETMLQISCCYGNLSSKLVSHVVGQNPSAMVDIIDVIPYQLHRLANKLVNHPFKNNINLWVQDASITYYKSYDCIIIYFLLNEVPDFTKKSIIEIALSALNSKGKLIIVDYQKPNNYNPLNLLVKPIFYFYKPFGFNLWERGILGFTNKLASFTTKTTKYFGGLYQKAVIVKNN